MASFYRNRVVVFDVDIASSSGATQVALTGGVELSSSALQWPHGVDFLDDDTVIVTSRGRDVAFFELPPGNRDVRSLEVLPIARWPSDRTTLMNAPGSVAVSHVGDDGCEVLICNNDGHTVTRHLLDCDAGRAVRHSEILLQKYLDIPDGVSVSPDRRWIAVSNHATHHVLLYQNSPALSANAEPDGILRQASYPHGLRFSADGRHLFVADAGAPYLHIYAQDSDEWRGVRHPLATVRIMDDPMFERGRRNPEEGGPKGLDIDARSRVARRGSRGFWASVTSSASCKRAVRWPRGPTKHTSCGTAYRGGSPRRCDASMPPSVDADPRAPRPTGARPRGSPLP